MVALNVAKRCEGNLRCVKQLCRANNCTRAKVWRICFAIKKSRLTCGDQPQGTQQCGDHPSRTKQGHRAWDTNKNNIGVGGQPAMAALAYGGSARVEIWKNVEI